MLSNAAFISKAPEAKVNMEKAKLAQHKENLASLQDKLAKL
jgi:valyl-tRNA synthetase